jgi:hypothetical protein
MQTRNALTVAFLALCPTVLAYADPLYPYRPSGYGVAVVAPPAIIEAPLPPPGPVNSAGWNTGYSVVTSSSDRINPLGGIPGESKTIRETTTQVVPNNALGQPMRGRGIDNQPNSRGWYTGYSVVTETYQRSDPLAAMLGGSGSVTESTTSIVPNDALGNPITGFGYWPSH